MSFKAMTLLLFLIFYKILSLFSCQECDISAHRLVLAASSSYFYAMFTNDLHESTSNKVEIKNVDSQTMQNLVNYAYTSQIEIRKDNVQVTLIPSRTLSSFGLKCLKVSSESRKFSITVLTYFPSLLEDLTPPI